MHLFGTLQSLLPYNRLAHEKLNISQASVEYGPVLHNTSVQTKVIVIIINSVLPSLKAKAGAYRTTARKNS